MAHLWFVLTTHLSLEDVQAALNVLIAVLSAASIFTFARFCWQSATLHLTRNRDVPVASLLSLTSPGEVFTVLRFLHYRTVTTRRYRLILAQAVVIVALSTAAFLSGPIARFSSRRSHVIGQRETRGALASNTGFDSMVDSDVEWNQTKSSIEAAGFPMDQLLDFLPDTTVPWVYRADEWNNTWHLNCTFTPETPIKLEVLANVSESGGDWMVQIPGLKSILPEPFSVEPLLLEPGITSSYQGFMATPIHGSEMRRLSSLMFLFYTIQAPQTKHPDISMSVLIAGVHVQNALGFRNGSYAVGPVDRSSYSRTICDLHRNPKSVNETYIAYPNIYVYADDTFSEALVEHYYSNWFRAFHNHEPAPLPTPEDMLRFYQAYTISKDTIVDYPVTRRLSNTIPAVELSSIFLAVVLADALLILLGLLYHSFFLLRYRSQVVHMPESKLDWLLQSLKEADRMNYATETTPVAPKRNSLTPLSPTSSRRRSTFESARYRFGTDGEVILSDDLEMSSPSENLRQVNSEASLLSRPESVRSGLPSYRGYEHVPEHSIL